MTYRHNKEWNIITFTHTEPHRLKAIIAAQLSKQSKQPTKHETFDLIDIQVNTQNELLHYVTVIYAIVTKPTL